MIELIQYTSEFDYYDPKKPYLKADYNILIKHDVTKFQIGAKFRIRFLDSDNEEISKMNVNTWQIRYIFVSNHYGQAVLSVSFADPKGIVLPSFNSRGTTLVNSEKDNISWLKEELTVLLKRIRYYSFFLDYRSRLDYFNLIEKEQPELKDISMRI
jgi:hypothetical protein